MFRIAFTGDFLNADGKCAYTTEGLELLDQSRQIQYHYIRDQQPRRDDPEYWQRFYSLEVSAAHIAQVDGLVVLRPWVKAATFARGAGDLVVIGRSGAGYDKIDLAACTANGVAVFNVPTALDHSTASTALMFMLALVKRLPEQERVARANEWEKQADVLGGELQGRTLGIVGLGRSGRELARLVAPFNMRLLAYSPHATQTDALALGVELTSLENLLKESDIVSLHARLTEANHQIIAREQFRQMKPTSFLVNVARGELIDQSSLVEALRERRIAGSALDVYEKEPPLANDPLLSLDNVILTPHWSCSTIDVWRATGRAMAEGMLRASRGEMPENVVNREVLENSVFREKLAKFAATKG